MNSLDKISFFIRNTKIKNKAKNKNKKNKLKTINNNFIWIKILIKF